MDKVLHLLHSHHFALSTSASHRSPGLPKPHYHQPPVVLWFQLGYIWLRVSPASHCLCHTRMVGNGYHFVEPCQTNKFSTLQIEAGPLQLKKTPICLEWNDSPAAGWSHPNNSLVSFFMSGISEGLRLGFNRDLTLLKSAHRNLTSVAEQSAVVEEYLAAELAQSCIAGPFDKVAIPEAHINRFWVIPKKYLSNKWRLIIDFSHSKRFSINNGIPKDLCSLTYITLST